MKFGIPLLFIGACALGMCGCRTATEPHSSSMALAQLGEKAADIDRAAAGNLREEALRIDEMRKAISRTQEQLLADSRAYGNASSDAWSDMRIARRDRPAVAAEYAVWYNQRVVEVEDYRVLKGMYHGAITIVEAKRGDTMYDINKFAGRRAHLPQ